MEDKAGPASRWSALTGPLTKVPRWPSPVADGSGPLALAGAARLPLGLWVLLSPWPAPHPTFLVLTSIERCPQTSLNQTPLGQELPSSGHSLSLGISITSCRKPSWIS